ncbi:MAG: hypothetical protein RSE12_08650 [Fuscovulum sp.]|nr:MAG: hypothetical protein RSE12_08650 [Fuscovulum sp.]
MKRKNPFPGVSRVTDRHKKVRYRFRVYGKIDMYLPGPYGSKEFCIAYDRAIAGLTEPSPKAARVDPNSFAGLIVRYKSTMRYADLSLSRKKTLQRELAWLMDQIGDLPFRSFQKKHVEALMKKKAGPVAANTVKKNLSMLFNFAIGEEILKDNPAKLA